MTKSVFAIEGIDRLGKSTVIQGIRQKLGYYEVVHFSKPERLEAYANAPTGRLLDADKAQLYHYQHESFLNSMLMAKSGARLIFDRWHLGECVYAPLYRGYPGDYVFDLEVSTGVADRGDIRLVLLTEDMDISMHFVDDQQSLGAVENRRREQEMFISAFERSKIRDKRVVCVTDPGLGGFKPKEWILQEVLS